MGFFGAGLGIALGLWTCWLGSVVCAVQDYWDDPSHLHCGSEVMEFSLPSLLEDAAFALTIIDKDGKSHYLHNDSSCGTWIGQKSDSSVVIGSSFDGCYVRKENGNYMVTVTLEEILHTGKSQYHKKDLMCPILPALPAMDAPSASECASVQQADRLQCANDSVSREICEGLGCCFSQDVTLRCFYGKKLTAYCSAENTMVVAISKDLAVPSLLLDSVRVVDVDSNSCPNLRVATTASFIGYQIPLSCGSPQQVAGMSIVYEHTFEATKNTRTWPMGSITRDSTIRVTVRCSYSNSGITPLQVEVLTLPPPLPVSTSGPLLLEMRIARDGQYTTYYASQDYPIERILRDPVDVEVRILQRTDPSIILVLNNCWATNSPVPTDAPQWPILLNSCPFEGDNYLTQLVPVGPSTQAVPFPTHYKRFIVSTFTFVDSSTQTALNGLVYFHCSASVCVPSATESCSVNCAPRNRRAAKSWEPEDAPTTVTSHGPVMFYSEAMEADKVLHEEEGSLGSDLALIWLQGAASVGFVLMVSLLGIYLYSRQKKCAVSSVNA
ncbi:zona pellucida sperm-binding protein 4-like isoform X1 [Hyla sarda]|uniref:zona pellucida sperm-binding protein 4-like isoform X1 n=2 Tax=Hyla sarda TaxID=327740 RepID=UPI0024C2408C|nr:zona pellucida sperm-binding protein 4-like isoform X1 [Hyla sarda]